METLQRTANRGSVSTGYEVGNSCKFESDGTNFLTRSVSSSSNRRTWTYSTWLKITELGVHNYFFDAYKNSNTFFILGISDAGRLVFYDIIAGTDYGRQTSALLRDTSAWYNVVFVSDTTNGTAADRYRLYLNGTRVTDFDTSYGDPGQNYDGSVNDAIVHNVGKRTDIAKYFNGYLCETVLVDGTALDPDSFGEFDAASGIWKPIDVSGLTFGTNGFYLDYADAADLGDDESGNGNDYSENNIDANSNSATDTCTNNFCTFNPLFIVNNQPTITQGAMVLTGGGGTWNQAYGSIGVSSGKWYYEVNVVDASDSGYHGFSTSPAEGAYVNNAQFMYNTSLVIGEANSIDYYIWSGGSQTSNESTGWGTLSDNDILGFALDLDASTRTVTFYRNGTALSGTTANPVNLPTNMQTGFIFPLAVQYENNDDEFNFGGFTVHDISSAASDANGYGTFEIAPPSGYYAICTQNLALYGG